MAIHEELKPDDAALPYLMARANRLMSTDNSARTAGTIVVPNYDGTDTVLGVNGMAPWVGDTTPPGRPLDIEATSHLGTALIRWNGELEGGVPDDFLCVQVWVKPVGDPNAQKVLAGELSAAGEVNTGVFAAETVLDVWAVALDNAHNRDGSAAYNVSAESEHVQVEILPIVSQQEFDEAADNILAAADESAKAHIKLVEDTMGEISDAVASNTDAIVLEKTLREEGVKVAQDTANNVKSETEKLKGDYAGMATDVAHVQQSIVQVATKADTALATANGKNRRYVQPTAPSDTSVFVQGDEWWQTSSKPLETYWTGEPNNSPSVLVDHSNEVEHVWVWNGSRWNEQVLSAEHLLVPGSIAVGLVTANFFDGAVVKGGAFLTSNERIKLTNAGFVMVDASGHPLVTLDATTGTATFQDVHIIDGALSAPTVSGGTFNGGEYNILDASGKLIASINSSGVVFGDSLAYGYDSKLKRWTLTLDGALMSKGELSGVTVIGSTIATNREDRTGIKMTDAGLVAYKNKTPVFEITPDGNIQMTGAVSTNGVLQSGTVKGGTVVGTKIKTLEADKRGVELEGRKLVAYNDSGQELLSLNGSGAGEALLTGGVRTARSGNHVRVRSQAFASGGQTKYKGIVGGYIDDTLMWGISGDTTTLDGSSRLDLYLNPQAPDIYLERQANGITNGSWWSNHLFFHARQWSATDKPSKAGGDILLSALGADGSTTGNLVVDYTDVSMWAISGDNEKRLIVAPDKVTINGHRIDNLPDMYCGSTVITPSGSSNRHTLFTQAQWKAITGLDDPGARNPLVLVSNGDTDARNVAMVGAGYSGSTKTWYVYLSNSVNKGDVFRVNYCILIRQ